VGEAKDPRAEAGPGEVAAANVHAENFGVAAGKIEGGVHVYGPGGSGEEQSPIGWQGRLAGASSTRLGVHPLPGDRRKTFAGYVPRDQDGELRILVQSEPLSSSVAHPWRASLGLCMRQLITAWPRTRRSSFPTPTARAGCRESTGTCLQAK
jgi:hypothetical protein